MQDLLSNLDTSDPFEVSLPSTTVLVGFDHLESLGSY